VSLYTQALADRYAGSLEGDGKTFVHFIVDNATRMEQMIRDLLEYSSVDADHTRGLEATSCETALDFALENLDARIAESGARIRREPLPTVNGEITHLVRLFQNLIGNSIKYRHPERPVRISISARQLGAEWVFSVADNGTGFEPQYAERVFGIFKRLHGRDNPGTGMGLAICRKIVEFHGGRIWVESAEGEGATFLFTLPSHRPA
jgi:light-regulated signal transduction histidine kinase (bacteriophytochrome)